MSSHTVIIGSVALGPKAACRIKRLDPEAKVTMIDRMSRISYGGCGIPYFVSGDVSAPEELQQTSFHMLRDPYFFDVVKGVDVRPRTEAVAIDKKAKTVAVRNLDTGAEETLAYDNLVIATGSSPRSLPIEGADAEGVYPVSNLDEAIGIKEDIAQGKVDSAVVIGGGFIGLEMAEALADMWGVETTVVEVVDQILPGVASRVVAHMAETELVKNDVTVLTGEMVQKFETDENGRVARVVTDKRTIDAQLVIMSVGVAPNDALAREAGLACHDRGGIIVDERMRTSDPNIYSGGDCVVVKNSITGEFGFLPLGSMANRQGRVVGTNIAGGNARFEGFVGTWCVKIFEQGAAGAGLTIQGAKRAGFDAVSAQVMQFDRAHFYPTKDLMFLELVVEKATRRVLGIQGISNNGDALLGRINAVAAILADGATVDDIGNLEVAYSPPYASAMDVVNSLGNAADNLLAGRNRGIDAETFQAWWDERDKGETVFLDCRARGNADDFAKKFPDHWTSIPQDELSRRIDEVPTDKRIVLICNTGVRSFEAQVYLASKGITDTHNLQGGMSAAMKWGLEL